MSLDISLSAEQLAAAEALAEETYDRFKDVHGHYPNKPGSHRVGKLAEFAVEQWLRNESFDPDPAYRDIERSSEPDLLIGQEGVAVKGWTSGPSWEEGGRCIRPQQISGITKNKAIVWCYVNEAQGQPVRLTIAGWSTPDEVAAKPITMTGPAYPPLENHQVPVEELRPPEELIRVLRASL